MLRTLSKGSRYVFFGFWLSSSIESTLSLLLIRKVENTFFFTSLDQFSKKSWNRNTLVLTCNFPSHLKDQKLRKIIFVHFCNVIKFFICSLLLANSLEKIVKISVTSGFLFSHIRFGCNFLTIFPLRKNVSFFIWRRGIVFVVENILNVGFNSGY